MINLLLTDFGMLGGVMHEHEKLNYAEFPTRDLAASKRFFGEVFAWEFEDFGPDYTAFSNQGLDGGFFRAELSSRPERGAGLLIFYSQDIAATQAKVERAGGVIVQPIFSFPGGRRFHFTEPGGNEFAVWTELD